MHAKSINSQNRIYGKSSWPSIWQYFLKRGIKTTHNKRKERWIFSKLKTFMLQRTLSRRGISLNGRKYLQITYIWRVSAHLCLTLWDPMNCSPPGSFIHGVFQSRRQKWVAISSRSSGPGIKLVSPALAGGFFTTVPPDSRYLIKGLYLVYIQLNCIY